jgi:hypothetical protein
MKCDVRETATAVETPAISGLTPTSGTPLFDLRATAASSDGRNGPAGNSSRLSEHLVFVGSTQCSGEGGDRPRT